MLGAVAALQALGLTPVLLQAVLYDSGGSAPSALAIVDLNLDGVADAVVSHFAASDTSPNGTLAASSLGTATQLSVRSQLSRRARQLRNPSPWLT